MPKSSVLDGQQKVVCPLLVLRCCRRTDNVPYSGANAFLCMQNECEAVFLKSLQSTLFFRARGSPLVECGDDSNLANESFPSYALWGAQSVQRGCAVALITLYETMQALRKSNIFPIFDKMRRWTKRRAETCLGRRTHRAE